MVGSKPPDPNAMKHQYHDYASESICLIKMSRFVNIFAFARCWDVGFVDMDVMFAVGPYVRIWKIYHKWI